MKYQKYVNALFLISAALVWFTAQHYTSMAIGYFQLGRKMGGASDLILHGVPLILGILTFVLLRQNHTSRDFVHDAVAELDLVSWPTQKEVRLGTVVVIITVVVAGIALGLIDIGFTAVIRTLIGA